MNNVVLVGRLVRDPVLRYTSENNRAVADFTLAIDRRFQRDQTDFIRIVVWGKQAENVANYLKKGSMCAVNGSIQTGRYVDKNGVTRYTTDVVANEVEFLSPASSSGSPQRDPMDEEPYREPASPREDLDTFDDSDIPF